MHLEPGLEPQRADEPIPSGLSGNVPAEIQVTPQTAAGLAAGDLLGDAPLHFVEAGSSRAGERVRNSEAFGAPGADGALSCRRRIHVPAGPGTVARLPLLFTRQVTIDHRGGLLAGSDRVDDGVGARHDVAARKQSLAAGRQRTRVGRNRPPIRRLDFELLGCRRADALDLGFLPHGHNQRVERQHVRSREPCGACPDDGHLEGLSVAALSRVTRT